MAGPLYGSVPLTGCCMISGDCGSEMAPVDTISFTLFLTWQLNLVLTNEASLHLHSATLMTIVDQGIFGFALFLLVVLPHLYLLQD